MGFLIFGTQIKIPGDMLCPTILILPHPTLSIGILFFQGRPGILHPPSCMDIKWNSPVYLGNSCTQQEDNNEYQLPFQGKS